jgi:hypothetical protein
MANAALRGKAIGHFLDRATAPTQDRHLQAAIMIEMHMRGSDAEIVVVVLGMNQALR